MDITWLDELLKRNMYETLITSYRIAERSDLKRKKPTSAQFAAKPPEPKIPRSLKDLVKVWDYYRKRGNLIRTGAGMILNTFMSWKEKLLGMSPKKRWMMSDLRQFKTLCCDFPFIGMNHCPEYNGMCRHCKKPYEGERLVRKF